MVDQRSLCLDYSHGPQAASSMARSSGPTMPSPFKSAVLPQSAGQLAQFSPLSQASSPQHGPGQSCEQSQAVSLPWQAPSPQQVPGQSCKQLQESSDASQVPSPHTGREGQMPPKHAAHSGTQELLGLDAPQNPSTPSPAQTESHELSQQNGSHSQIHSQHAMQSQPGVPFAEQQFPAPGPHAPSRKAQAGAVAAADIPHMNPSTLIVGL